MKAGSKAPPSRKVNVGGKAAGAGGGTLVVLIANSLPQNSSLKPWILAAAPTLTVVLSTFSSWGTAAAVDYVKKRRLDLALARFKKKAQEELCKDGISTQQKQMLRRHLENLQKIEVSNEIQQIQSLMQIQQVAEFSDYGIEQSLTRIQSSTTFAIDEVAPSQKRIAEQPNLIDKASHASE